MRLRTAIVALLLASCNGTIEGPTGLSPGSPPSATADGGAACVPVDEGDPEAPIAESEPLSAERVLRRIHLVLRGRPPLEEDQEALAAATSDEERETLLARAIDEGLTSTDFYERMLDFGHHWMRNSRFGGGGDGYWGNMSAHLGRCGSSTLHAGAYYLSAENGGSSAPRGDRMCSLADARVRDVEPWWAPGTTIRLIGDAALENRESVDADGTVRDCGKALSGYFDMIAAPGCGCGPHAVWCFPGRGLNPDVVASQARHVWDEPARLVAHLAWHDRPLSDVVLGNYTVANTWVRAWYLRFGRQTGVDAERLDADASWFRPEIGDHPRDPLHPEAGDIGAWRELVVEELAPQLLSLSGGARSNDPERTLRWDPRVDTGPAPGLPAAGVLTMAGPNSTFPRERPRAARFLEIFACREFDPPPSDQHFPPVSIDLATSGQCMHCHVLMDPVAMAFKRWIFMGQYVPLPRLADYVDLEVPQDLYDPRRRNVNGRWFASGAERWAQNWQPNTTMTPITEEDLASNMGALFLDTIPPEYTVLGEHTDGTMGPLGFAKVLVSSGEFDRCAVRRIYERVMGRRLDPAREARFIEALATQFASEGRIVRSFVESLLESPEFRRGL